MLGSIIRSLIFVALIAGAIWGISLLQDTPGEVTITLQGEEIRLTLLAAAAGLVLAFFAIWVGLKLLGLLIAILRFLAGDETALTRYYAKNRMRRGLEALSKGMTAVAAGDAKAALAKAKKAERLLQRPELTRLLNAQAAELAGDTRRANAYYKALAADPDTAYVGIKGLLGQALESGDTDKALKLAEYGFALKPRDPKLLETLYGLQSEAFDWTGARRTLGAQRRIGTVPKDEAARREATLALAQAEDATLARDEEESKKRALEAATLDPGNVDAVVSAAKRQIGDGNKRAASRQIVEAWGRNPDPRLAAVFAEIEPEEAPARRRKRFQRLFDANPTHAETKFLRAELALHAEDWAGARAAIDELKEDEPSARSLAIMAAIARGEGEPDHVVRGWLARALGAPREIGSDGEIGRTAMLTLLIDEVEDADISASAPRAAPRQDPGPDAGRESGFGASASEENARSGGQPAGPEASATVHPAQDPGPGSEPETGHETGHGTPHDADPAEPGTDGTDAPINQR